jgi:hypothetical protein
MWLHIRRRTRRSVRHQWIPHSRPFSFNDIEGTHYGAWLLGHAKLETTSLYTRVATNTIRTVMSPLDRLTPLRAGRAEPPA